MNAAPDQPIESSTKTTLNNEDCDRGGEESPSGHDDDDPSALTIDEKVSVKVEDVSGNEPGEN